ncbi:MAG: hypothetical protein ABRQ39_27275, partial [Candidatus Eremiobacterota bacterium]
MKYEQEMFRDKLKQANIYKNMENISLREQRITSIVSKFFKGNVLFIGNNVTNVELDLKDTGNRMFFLDISLKYLSNKKDI